MKLANVSALKAASRSGLCLAALFLTSFAISSGQTLSFTQYALPSGSTGNQPMGITVGPDGALWFVEFTGNMIGRITTNGVITEYPVPSPGGNLIGIAVGPDGALWFTEQLANNIGRLTPDGMVTEFPLPTAGEYPTSITVGSDGAMWFNEFDVVHFNKSQIGRITMTGVITEFPLPAPDCNPYRITSGPDGALWFTEYVGNKIGRLTTSGSLNEFSLRAPNPAFGPGDITTGPDGSMWFADTNAEDFGGNKIGRITMAGIITEFPLGNNDSSPFALTAGSDGALWFTEQSANKIGRITTSGVITIQAGVGTNAGPTGIVTGPDGALWYSERFAGKIARAVIGLDLSFTNALRVAQVAEGASWKTSFAIVNLDLVPVRYEMRFWGDNGAPLQLPILSGPTAGTLPPGGSAFIETPGNTAAMLQGWAEVASDGRLGVLTIFRQSVPGRPDAEGTVTGTLSGNRIFLPFDNTSGFVTGIAIANTNPSQQLGISLLFQFEGGGQFAGSLLLPPHAHTAFVLPVMFPAVAGSRGSVLFSALSSDMTVVGLRVSPTNSFTSLGVFQ